MLPFPNVKSCSKFPSLQELYRRIMLQMVKNLDKSMTHTAQLSTHFISCRSTNHLWLAPTLPLLLKDLYSQTLSKANGGLVFSVDFILCTVTRQLLHYHQPTYSRNASYLSCQLFAVPASYDLPFPYLYYIAAYTAMIFHDCIKVIRPPPTPSRTAPPADVWWRYRSWVPILFSNPYQRISTPL